MEKKKKKSKWANLVLCEIFFGGKKNLWGMIDNEGKETQIQKET